MSKIGFRNPHNCSGQVLTEACIGLALLVFAWIIISYSLWLSNNRIRTAMAARHAAWIVGNKPGLVDSLEALSAKIDEGFFYENGVVQVRKVDSIVADKGRIDTGSDNAAINAFLYKIVNSMDRGPYKMNVRFGIDEDDLKDTDIFPFTLMKTQVPFMPDSLLANWLSVESHCQWAAVKDTWSTDNLIELSANLIEWIKTLVGFPSSKP